MSIRVDCPACMSGNHEGHVQDWGLRPGLIGGSYCGCRGDCKERAEQAYKRLMAPIEEVQAF